MFMSSFSEEELKEFKKLTELYLAIKEKVIYLEEIDPDLKTPAQALTEFRDALDHIMRVLSVKLDVRAGIPDKKKEEYITKNLSKAYDHLFRAGYDVLDMCSLIIRSKIAGELEGYEVEVINTALPEYYPIIKPGIEEITEEFVKARKGKDVGISGLENFDLYLEQIDKLKGYYKKILKAQPSLIEISKKTKETKWKNLIIVAILGIIGGVAVAYLANLFIKS